MKGITGVVLCGGRSSRMGGAPKSLIRLNGETMLERILRRVAHQVDRMILGSNAIEDYRRYGEVVSDGRQDIGPLGGIESALLAIDSEFLFVCPGDCPDIPETIVERLGVSIGSGTAAVAHDGHRLQNLVVLVRRDAGAGLSRWLDDGGRRVDAWLQSIDAQVVQCDDLADGFININTPADLERWQAGRRQA